MIFNPCKLRLYSDAHFTNSRLLENVFFLLRNCFEMNKKLVSVLIFIFQLVTYTIIFISDTMKANGLYIKDIFIIILDIFLYNVMFKY